MRRRLAPWSAIVLVVIAPFVRAADAPATPTAPAASATPAAPRADAAPEAITAWTQDALQELIDVRARVEITPDIGRQLDDLAALRKRYDTTYDALRKDPTLLDNLTETALQDARTDLAEISSATAEADRSLTEAASRLETQLTQIVESRDRARALRDAPTETPLPSALRGRLDAIMQEAAPVQRIAEQSLDRLARAQSGVLKLKQNVDALRSLAAETSARRVRELFRFHEPRLWKVTPDNVAAATLHSGSLAGSSMVDALRKFASEHGGGIALHIIAFVLILAGVLRLGRSQQRLPEDERSRALTRPISASVLIALLLTPLIHPDAPYSVRQLALATLIVPMLRIVTLYFDRTAWPQLFSLIGLFFVERILSALSMELLVQRLVLLTLSIATTALFFWARRSGLETHLGLEEPAQSWAKRLFTVSLIASGVAVLLNLFGNLTLALVIQSAVVRCVLLAASLRAMVVVVREVGRLVTHTFERRGWRAVANNRAAIMRRLDTWTVVLGSAIWIYYTLTMLRLDEIVVASVTSVLGAEAKIGAVTLSLSGVLVSIAAIWIAVRVSGITRALLNDDVLPRFPLPRGVPNAISVLVNYTILLFGFLLGAGILGISLSSLTIIMGALGVGIGFGLQNIVNNFVSGLILVFERPVQVGDAVQFNQLSGVVTQIGFRASRIRTYSGSEVIVPNGDLISGHLVNWTLSDRRRRLELPVTVAYGTDCDLVEHTLLDVVRANKEVMVDPPPLAILENFGASAIEFKVYCWIADYDMGLRVRNQLNHAMVHALAEKGIEVPGARREVYMMPPRA